MVTPGHQIRFEFAQSGYREEPVRRPAHRGCPGAVLKGLMGAFLRHPAPR